MPAPKSSKLAAKRAEDESVVERTLEEKPPSNSSTPSSLKRPILPFLPERGFFFYFLIILLAATVILVISFFLMDSNNLPSFFNKSNNNQKLDFNEHIRVLSNSIQSAGLDSDFSNSIAANLKNIQNSTDKDSQYKVIQQSALIIGSEYSENHNFKLREFLQEFDNFAAQNYPEIHIKSAFLMPCTDDKCGMATQDPEIDSLKNKIQESELGLNKENMLSALSKVAYASEGEELRRLNGYIFVLEILEKEGKKGNLKAQALSLELHNYLKSDFSQLYEEYLNIKKAL